MNSLSICLLLVAGLVSAHEGPVGVVEQPAHVEQPQANQALPVQAQPVPVHVVDFAHPPQNVADVHKNLYMPSSLSSYQGEWPVQNNKPVPQVGGQVVPNKEQYGAPEPAGLPANYKPFGSWGLYIGGNPPDGYYSNFYKNLDGVQSHQAQSVPSAGQQQPSPLSSYVYKQSGPVQSDYLQPFVYSADELNSGYPIPGQPLSYMPDSSEENKPQFYASKVSPAQQVREMTKTSERASSSSSSGVKGSQQQQQQQQQVKGHYSYSPVAYNSAVQYSNQAHQVLPYSVPVGSQIVGSQPGVEGAFSPYGIHAFTRYALKPVAGQNQYVQYGVPAPVESVASQNEQSVYKQRGQYQQFGFYQPATFGYQAYQVGLPSLQNQFTAHSVSSNSAPVSGQVVPLASPVSVETPVVPVSPVAAPASPVQVGQQVHASPSSSLDSSVSQQQEQVQQQQVVEQKQVEKSGVKQ